MSIMLGFIGILLFMNPMVSVDYSIYGVFLALLGSFAAAFYFGIGRFVRKDTDLLSYTIIAYSTASVALFFYALIVKENLFFYSLETYYYFILLALLPMISGHTLINYLLKYVKTSVATSITLGEPIGSSIMAYFLLNQYLDFPKIIAMTFVLLSLAFSIIIDLRANKNKIS
jgi:drug/metabolite transporter (DMT)-like permease